MTRAGAREGRTARGLETLALGRSALVHRESLRRDWPKRTCVRRKEMITVSAAGIKGGERKGRVSSLLSVEGVEVHHGDTEDSEVARSNSTLRAPSVSSVPPW